MPTERRPKSQHPFLTEYAAERTFTIDISNETLVRAEKLQVPEFGFLNYEFTGLGFLEQLLANVSKPICNLIREYLRDLRKKIILVAASRMSCDTICSLIDVEHAFPKFKSRWEMRSKIIPHGYALVSFHFELHIVTELSARYLQLRWLQATIVERTAFHSAK
ncbi:hypothetical protein Ciccas_007899 [Cichlidogyrus casuarinus]|uniref:Uncharacterized protein n=1 Tax=Cichlidogyrus casuarinus TaxID=1844966 RepID=A0ABD2Q1M4_9PLAT